MKNLYRMSLLFVVFMVWAHPLSAQTGEEQKTLDEVIVEGKRFDRAQPLPTGEIELSPELITRVNGESSRAALHAYYELVFDPVVVHADGSIQIDPDPRRKRETLRPQLREKRARTGSNIKRVPPSFYKFTLEEGFYALTQVNYSIQTRPTIIDPNEGNAISDFEVESSLDEFRYCLAKGTLLFDVQKDQTATFGKVMIKGLGRVKHDYDFPGHFPIVATEAPATRPADGYVFAKDPDQVAWGVGYFDANNMCEDQNDRRFVTSGWPISENWVW